MVSGRVRWFDDERGFGFLAPDGSDEDVFCHWTTIVAPGTHRTLLEGQRLEFDVFDSPEGRVAGNVHPVAGEPPATPDEVLVRAFPYRRPNLETMAARLRPFGEVHRTGFLVRLRAPPHELTLFDDGRAIVKGTGEEEVAVALVSRWLGVRVAP
jgi:CspA family cold shock protein